MLINRVVSIAGMLVAFVYLGLGVNKTTCGSISGYVIDRQTGEPISSANAMILESRIGAATNQDGQFTISNLPWGTYKVRVSVLGYKPVVATMTVNEKHQRGNHEFSLIGDNIKLGEVQVCGNVNIIDQEMPVSTQCLESRVLRSTAGSLDDVMRSVSILPGVATTSIERNDLIVRGGAPSENLFIIDNIEVPSLSHFATQGAGGGSASIVDMEFIDRVIFSSGGFGVQHGDKLSSVISLALREGDCEHQTIKATVSATQFGTNLEGPISTTGSYFLAARKSYLDLVFKAYDMSFAPVFMDVLAKASFRLETSDRIDLLAIAKSDKVKLFNDTENHLRENARIIFGNQDAVVGGITWKHIFVHAYTVVTLANSYGRYEYFQGQHDKTQDFNDDSYENETSLSVDAVGALSETSELSAGIKGKLIAFQDKLNLQTIPWFLTLNNRASSIQRSIDTTAMKLAGYVHISQTLNNLVINAGIRVDYFDLIENGLVFSPRLSAIYHLSPITDITGSLGQYYQAPAYKWLANPYNRALVHSGAEQVVLGITHRFSEEWKVSLETYSKTYFDYPSSIECPVLTMFNSGAAAVDYQDFGMDSLASAGAGTSRGIELFVQKRASEKPVSGILSVSYSATNFTTLDGISRPADHDQRLIVTMVLNYRIAAHLEVSTKFRMYTGHPYLSPQIRYFGTMADFYQEYNKMRVDLNHSLDVRLTRQGSLGRLIIECFLDIQNVYNRKPLDTPVLDTTTGKFVQPSTVGIIPSIGLSVKF